MSKRAQQTQDLDRSRAHPAPSPDESQTVGEQEPSRPITARPKLAAQGIARLQRQLGNQAISALLRAPKPSHDAGDHTTASPVQRVIRPSAGAKPYTTPEEVISAHPTGGTQPTSLNRSILSKLIEASETEFDIDASTYSSWEAIVKAHKRLEAPETTPTEKDTTTTSTEPSSAAVTHGDVELLVDDNYLPIAIQSDAPAALVWKLKGWSGDTWEAGKIFYTTDAEPTSPLIPLPPEQINAYWDELYPSPFKRVSSPTWRANCADHAIGQPFEDVGPAKAFLKNSWANKGDHTGTASIASIVASLPPGEYVAQVSNHFIRLTVGPGSVFLSQKDAESGIYEATMSKEAAADYVLFKSGSWIIYQKP